MRRRRSPRTPTFSAFPLNYYYRTIYSQIVDPNNKKSLGGFGKWRHDGLARPDGQGNHHAEQRHALQLGVGRCSQRTVGAGAAAGGWRPILQQRLGRSLGSHHRLSRIHQRGPEGRRLPAGADVMERREARGDQPRHLRRDDHSRHAYPHRGVRHQRPSEHAEDPAGLPAHAAERVSEAARAARLRPSPIGRSGTKPT